MSSPKKTAAWLPNRFHHHAWVTTDQQATRAFYQDIVGLPLMATWTEAGPLLGEREQAYCHTLYGLGDGSSLAFFQFAEDDFARRHAALPTDCPFRHLALLVAEPTQRSILNRAIRSGLAPELVDHGYCRSLYLTDPNGLRLEFTVDHPRADAINALRRETAHQDLQRWLGGDHTTNNDLRPDS